MAKEGTLRLVMIPEVHRFIRECMMKVGALEAHARQMADVLIEADRRGIKSHGLNRLKLYVDELDTKVCDGAVKPCIIRETAATAWVDGNHGLGPTVGNFCMKLAIKKARETGVGWVSAKGSNHFGICGWYAMMALKEKMIGMTFTSTSPLLCPTRAKQGMLGTNPMCVVAPAKAGDAFILDMATTAVAVGKIEVKQQRKEPLPLGWALDEFGRPTTDGDRAYNAGNMMPLGGEETTAGYKGYGLALMVEVFCGILAGATAGPDIRRAQSTEIRPADLGQSFVALNPSCFAPDFEHRLQCLMDKLRNLEPANKELPVLVAGDPERASEVATDKRGGVCYHITMLNDAKKMASRLKVQPLEYAT